MSLKAADRESPHTDCGLHNIRISGDNKIFYLSEDGSLYERTAEGDKLVIKVYPVSHQIVNFYEENLNDDDIISDEEDLEDDDFFSAEIGQGDEELLFGNISENIVTSELKEIEVLETSTLLCYT